MPSSRSLKKWAGSFFEPEPLRARVGQHLYRGAVEREPRRLDEVVQLRDARGAGDRRSNCLLGERPRDRQFPGRRIIVARDLVERRQDLHSALVQVPLHLRPAGARSEVRFRPILPGSPFSAPTRSSAMCDHDGWILSLGLDTNGPAAVESPIPFILVRTHAGFRWHRAVTGAITAAARQPSRRRIEPTLFSWGQGSTEVSNPRRVSGVERSPFGGRVIVLNSRTGGTKRFLERHSPGE